MADEEKTEEAAPAEGGKKLPIIIIVVLILVGLVLAGGISYFVTTQFMSAGNQASVENRNHDPGVFVKLGDAKEGIIVNVDFREGMKFEVLPAFSTTSPVVRLQAVQTSFT